MWPTPCPRDVAGDARCWDHASFEVAECVLLLCVHGVPVRGADAGASGRFQELPEVKQVAFRATGPEGVGLEDDGGDDLRELQVRFQRFARAESNGQ